MEEGKKRRFEELQNKLSVPMDAGEADLLSARSNQKKKVQRFEESSKNLSIYNKDS
jgi:hypothetical protein